MMKRYESWGKFPRVKHRLVKPIYWRDDPPRLDEIPASVLPYAGGRSYGDSCLNEGGALIDTSSLSHMIAFDREQGLFRCEAGVTLNEIIKVIVPHGWFLPVSPGTKFVSVAGAIANDIHGKNHHKAGTFGRHVTRFELLRSDGERLICSPCENEEMFRATIGGLGLTGVILWAEFNLKRIPGPMISMERIRFESIEEFFSISSRSDEDYEYTVAWLDCLARGKDFGRGIFMRGNHSDSPRRERWAPAISLPFDLPSFVLNRATMRLFNSAVYHSQRQKRQRQMVHFEPFFYPLDAIGNWNRIYGKAGFLQYQFVVPYDDDFKAIRRIVDHITHDGTAFLTVFKTFGDLPSPGVLSFPRPGVTLAVDFPHRGRRTLRLFDELDGMVRAAGGAVYPAKDARMSAQSFQCYYPQWEAFSQYVDPHFSSSFWRRVSERVKEKE